MNTPDIHGILLDPKRPGEVCINIPALYVDAIQAPPALVSKGFRGWGDRQSEFLGFAVQIELMVHTHLDTILGRPLNQETLYDLQLKCITVCNTMLRNDEIAQWGRYAGDTLS